MYKKFIFFFNQEIRDKIRLFERRFNIKIYPQYLKKTLIDKIKFKIIFYLTLNEKLKKIKSYYKKNFNPILNQQYDFITTFPRSGTNYVNSVINSYYEIYLKIGNGIMKYDGLKDDYYHNSASLNKDTEIHNGINFSQNFEFNNFHFKKYEREINFAGHFPLGDINTIFINNITFAVITRKRIEKSISSWYIMNRKNNQEIDYLYLNKIIKDYLYFDNFWKENRLNLKYKIFYYEDLIDNSYEEFLRIFNFFNVKCHEEILKEAINLNKYESVKKLIPNYSNRVTNIDYNEIRKNLESYIKEKIEKLTTKNQNKKFDK